jgi:hypothetical protein
MQSLDFNKMGLDQMSEMELMEIEGGTLFGKICKWVGAVGFIVGAIVTCGAALIIGGALVAGGIIEDGPSLS